MNREDTRKAAMVMMAYADGVPLEKRHRHSSERGWHNCNSPVWDWVNNKYRVKKRSGKVWLVIDKADNWVHTFTDATQAAVFVNDRTSSNCIIVPVEWEEE